MLGSLTDQEGYVWRRSIYDLYVIEAMPIVIRDENVEFGASSDEDDAQFVHRIFHYIPMLTCWSPKKSLDILTGKP